MSRSVTLILLAPLFCGPFAQGADEVNLDQIRALANTYFRDSTEIPMSVEVTTVVTDPGGKVKHQNRATAGMVFNGYNKGAGKFSLRANAGLMSAGAMRDSVSGDLAAFFAGGLISKKDPAHRFEIRQPAKPGEPIVVAVTDGDCPALELMPRWMFLQHPCGSARFTVKAGSGERPTFQSFSFDGAGSAAPAKIAWLGDVQVQAFHADVEFQEEVLPGDLTPYLWPLEAVTSVTTNKGSVRITNRYSPKK